MTNKVQYNIISKYRAELMGVAIIWIYLFHSKFNFPQSSIFYPLALIKEIGYGGVDIFFFISGFSLMYGMQNKQYSIGHFYIRRLLRILPTYWIVISIALIIDYISGEEVSLYIAILKYTTIAFWIDKYRFDWFVPSLIVLYALFPFFYHIYSKSEKKIYLILSIIMASILLDLMFMAMKVNYLLTFTTRIPIFFIGAHIGNISLRGINFITNREKSIHLFCVLSGFLVLSIILELFSMEERWAYGLWWYPFWLSTFPLCMILALMINRYEYMFAHSFLGGIKWLLIFCGRHSLEIFLVHTYIVFKVRDIIIGKWMFFDTNVVKGYSMEYLVYFVITLLISLQLNKISGMIQKAINPRKVSKQ